MSDRELFAGGSEMHARCRELDWSATVLGPVEAWPAVLCTTVMLCLDSLMPMAIWAGPELTLIYNDAYIAKLGARRHPGALGRPGQEVWVDLWDQLGPELEAVIARGEATYREDQQLMIDRGRGEEESYFTYSFSPIREPDGRIFGILGITHENTTQHRELVESEERYRTLFEAIDEGFALCELVTDESGEAIDVRLMELNPAWSALSGHDVGEVRGKLVWSELYAERDLDPEWLDTCAQVALQGESLRFEVYMEDHNCWLDCYAVPIGEKCEGLFAVVARDISERKLSEQVLRSSRRRLAAEAEALRESEARLRLATEAAGMFVWECDLDAQTIRWSSNAAAILGLRPEDLPEDLADSQFFVADDDAARVIRTFEDAVARHEDVYALELRGRGDPETARYYMAHARVFYDAAGAPSRVYGVTQDITERKRNEEALREAHRRKDEFLAMLGHELRNPLAAIRNSTELMKLAGSDNARLQRAQQVLERQSGLMTRLIDGLLEVSRIARGKIKLDRATLDVREVLEAVVNDRIAQIESRGLQFGHELPVAPVWVLGDAIRLVQVVDNLLGNAIKFTRAPGRVDLKLEERAGEAVISVADTGVGIRPEMLGRVFEPFQQDSEDIARSGGGLGLGLALARGLVELHGGRIEAHSAGPGTGAELVVRLPLAPAPAAREQLEEAAGTVPRRILIVEDNPDAGQTLRDLLEVLGHDVSLVETGIEALDTLRTRGADAVLCDLGLPGMSGYDLARAVRDDPLLQRTGLVAVTGYGQPDDRRRSAEAGFDDHLTKPVTVSELEAVLDRIS